MAILLVPRPAWLAVEVEHLAPGTAVTVKLSDFATQRMLWLKTSLPKHLLFQFKTGHKKHQTDIQNNSQPKKNWDFDDLPLAKDVHALSAGKTMASPRSLRWDVFFLEQIPEKKVFKNEKKIKQRLEKHVFEKKYLQNNLKEMKICQSPSSAHLSSPSEGSRNSLGVFSSAADASSSMTLKNPKMFQKGNVVSVTVSWLHFRCKKKEVATK